MIKTPITRHSKSRRTPVTIELGADEVKRVDESAPDQTEVQAEPVESIEVPAQPDAELQKIDVGTDGVEQGKAESEQTHSDPAFGRNQGASREPEPVASHAKVKGGVSNIAAGLIGAVLALGGFYGLQATGIMGTSGSTVAPSLAPLESQIAELKSDLDKVRSAPSAQSDLAASLDQLKSEVAALQAAAQRGDGGDGAAVAALTERIGKIEAASGVPQALNDQIAAVEDKVAAAVDSVGRSDARIASLEQSVSTLAGKVEQQASQPKVALAIAAAALNSAVDRGGPFAAEAETFAAIAPSAPELSALRQYADQGVATEADLVAAFPQAADSMMAAAIPEDPNAGLLQRLLESAQSVVKVRPVGSVAGDDPGARIARMEVALKAGNLEQAMAEYEGLPDTVKQAGATLAERIRARIEVTKLVDQLVAGAMKSA